MKTLLPLLLLSAAAGCARTGQQALSTTDSMVPFARDAIEVELHRLRSMQIPIAVGGASLRQVITRAKDVAGVAEVDRYTLNHTGTISRMTGLSASDIGRIAGASMNANEEWFVLVRGPLRIFVPELLVHGTAVGRIRVIPGDRILSLPDSEISRTESRIWPEPDDSKLRLTVTGRFVEPAEEKSDQKLMLEDVLRRMKPAGRTLDPNLVVISRTTAGTGDQILAFLGDGTEIGDATIKTSFPGATDHPPGSAPTLFDGDVIEVTRLELHPLVAAALDSPPPPAAPVIPIQTATSHHSKLQRHASESAQRLPLVTHTTRSLSHAFRTLGFSR